MHLHRFLTLLYISLLSICNCNYVSHADADADAEVLGMTPVRQISDTVKQQIADRIHRYIEQHQERDYIKVESDTHDRHLLQDVTQFFAIVCYTTLLYYTASHHITSSVSRLY